MEQKLSKKKLEQIRIKRENEKREAFEEYKRQLEEDYLDLHNNEFMDFYEYFCEELENKGLGGNKGFYGYFVDFLVENSSHREEFREMKIQEYLDEPSDEEDEDEEDEVGKYDFLYFKGGY